MLTKEYRIPLPLTVDEYRIAQLYMIAKKSRDETHGEGSGVEIIVNEPYEDGPGGTGQYTHKIYHVGSHLPAWLKSLLPKSALTVEEEAWNAYPYTKTRYTCPFVEKFSLEIETYYFNDGGHQDNVFHLSGAELAARQVDLIDVVRDQVGAGDYLKEEDPRLYVSQRTGRGPLTENWIEDYWDECKGKRTPLPNGRAIMCAYKLCKVEFRYWGMQSKIEKFIHDIALRKTMVRAHRQAWAWQDEWHGLTIADIRRIEADTQRHLAAKFQTSTDEGTEADEGEHRPEVAPPTVLSEELDTTRGESSDAAARRTVWSRSSSRMTLHSPGSTSGKAGLDAQLVSWRMESIRRDSIGGSSDDEFFDCEEEVNEHATLARWSSLELIAQEGATKDDRGALLPNGRLEASHSVELADRATLAPASTCSCDILLLVLHSGSVLDAHVDRGTKRSDVTTFGVSVEAILRQHYPALLGRLCIRLVSCPSICTEPLAILNSLSPYSFAAPPVPTAGGSAGGGASPNGDAATDPLPVGAIPLLAVLSPEHQEAAAKVAAEMNRTYHEFVRSPEGLGFQGQVSLVADSMASLLVYDVLSLNSEDADEHPPPSPGIGMGGFSPALSRAGDHHHTPVSAPVLGDYDSDMALSRDMRDLRRCKSDVPRQATDSGTTRTLSDSDAGTGRHLSPRRTSQSSDGHWRLDFEVTDLFMFGAPLGLVLAARRMFLPEERALVRPACHSVYNLFHATNPVACRLEPLICSRFAQVPPCNVCRYHKYPLGDGQPVHLLEHIQSRPELLGDPSAGGDDRRGIYRRESTISVMSTMSGMDSHQLQSVNAIVQRWWGNKRIDYALYCPEGLANFPAQVLPHLFHASYWESQDAIAFLLRNLLGGEQHYSALDGRDAGGAPFFAPSQAREKWIRKRTSVKIKNVTPNHRGNDVLVREGLPQVLSARFTYGPLDMVSLTGEKVDIHYMADPPGGDWILLGTEVSDKSGRVTHIIDRSHTLGFGLYPIKMVVRGDHTCSDFQLCVVPPQTEIVVFSIDGSFTASMSVTGRDPKVRAGAVDVVRHWQELGYLIVYVTGRPDMQRRKVLSWLSQHNFPHGLVSFADGLTTEPLKHKADYLRQLVEESEIVIHAGYGSSKDIGMYASVGLKPEQIYIVGKVSKKQQANFIADGYAAHLAELTSVGGSRAAKGNARMVLPRGCFGLNPILTRRRTVEQFSSCRPIPVHSVSDEGPEAEARRHHHSLHAVFSKRVFWSAKRATSFPAAASMPPVTGGAPLPVAPTPSQVGAGEGLFRKLAPRPGRTNR